MRLVPRLAWRARPPRARRRIPGPVEGVAIHWEGPPLGSFPHSLCAGKVRAIQRFHMDARGWDDIAYSAVVCPHGHVFEGRWIGIKTAANGTSYGNNRYYAVCYLGGQGDSFTTAGKRGVNDAIAALRRAGARRAVRPHSWFRPTLCPGNAIRAWLAAGRPGGTTPTPNPDYPAWPGRYLRLKTPFMRGRAVRLWQAQMRRRGWRIGVDGIYGPQSAAVCRAFQREKGLAVDGIVGPQTWRAAWRAPVT